MRLRTLCKENSPYSGTCPVPLFSSSLTRLPPALMSSMARAWVMSLVLSPLISMIWSPTWTRHTQERVSFCHPRFTHSRVTFPQNQSSLGEPPLSNLFKYISTRVVKSEQKVCSIHSIYSMHSYLLTWAEGKIHALLNFTPLLNFNKDAEWYYVTRPFRWMYVCVWLTSD